MACCLLRHEEANEYAARAGGISIGIPTGILGNASSPFAVQALRADKHITFRNQNRVHWPAGKGFRLMWIITAHQ